MPIQPGVNPLAALLQRRGIGPAVLPGQLPGTANPGGPPPGSPMPMPQGGPPGSSPMAPPSGPNPILFNRLMSGRLQADPKYVHDILSEAKMAFAHLIPYTAQTEGLDVSKDIALIFKQIENVIGKVKKNMSEPIPGNPINFAGAQSSGGMNANITPVNSLPVTGVAPGG